MLKKIIIGIGVLSLLGGLFVYMQFNKSHRDIGAEEIHLSINALDLFDSFVNDEGKANGLYLDQVIEVSGEISEMTNDASNTMVVLKTNDDFFGVNVYFEESSSMTGLKIGDRVHIKGQCTGGDDMGVVIAHSSIVIK